MDGNNRWSKKNNINKFKGYKKGAKTLLEIYQILFLIITNKIYICICIIKK